MHVHAVGLCAHMYTYATWYTCTHTHKHTQDPAHKDAMYYLVSGLDEGLLPDADLYVHIIDSQPTWVDAQDKLSEMRVCGWVGEVL